MNRLNLLVVILLLLLLSSCFPILKTSTKKNISVFSNRDSARIIFASLNLYYYNSVNVDTICDVDGEFFFLNKTKLPEFIIITYPDYYPYIVNKRELLKKATLNIYLVRNSFFEQNGYNVRDTNREEKMTLIYNQIITRWQNGKQIRNKDVKKYNSIGNLR